MEIEYFVCRICRHETPDEELTFEMRVRLNSQGYSLYNLIYYMVYCTKCKDEIKLTAKEFQDSFLIKPESGVIPSIKLVDHFINSKGIIITRSQFMDHLNRQDFTHPYYDDD